MRDKVKEQSIFRFIFFGTITDAVVINCIREIMQYKATVAQGEIFGIQGDEIPACIEKQITLDVQVKNQIPIETSVGWDQYKHDEDTHMLT